MTRATAGTARSALAPAVSLYVFEEDESIWEDILIRVRVTNRGPDAPRLDLLPTIWFRNTLDVVYRRAQARAAAALGRDDAGD